MINKIKSYLKFDKYFLKSSIIVFVGSMIVNVLNYVFHLILGRNLGPSGYGIAVSLISLLAIFSIPLGSVNTLVVNFTSEENAKKEY
jgi:O-antigen/teichoic acid export membrane protein